MPSFNVDIDTSIDTAFSAFKQGTLLDSEGAKCNYIVFKVTGEFDMKMVMSESGHHASLDGDGSEFCSFVFAKGTPDTPVANSDIKVPCFLLVDFKDELHMFDTSNVHGTIFPTEGSPYQIDMAAKIMYSRASNPVEAHLKKIDPAGRAVNVKKGHITQATDWRAFAEAAGVELPPPAEAEDEPAPEKAGCHVM